MKPSVLVVVGSMASFLFVSILVAQSRAEKDAAPTLGELTGHYAYVGNREKDEAAIKVETDAATAGMSRLVLKRAMPRLESSTRIPEQIMIALADTNVTFKMNDHVVTVPEHGGSVPVTTPFGDTADASFDATTATLLESVSKTGSQKKSSFRFNPAGQLVMEVRITNSKLASPVAFPLLYARLHP